MMAAKAFGWALGAILLGYAFLGKGFAYLHLPVSVPLFVGEIVLGLGLVVAVSRPAILLRALRNRVIWCYLAFGAVCLAQTIPHIGLHGIDAIRDAALYYYGAFTFLIVGILTRRESLARIMRLLDRTSPFFLLWVPVASLALMYARDVIPFVPDTTVPLLYVKAADTAIHVAAVLALIASSPRERLLAGQRTLWIFIGLFALSLTFHSRSATLSALLGITVAAGLLARRRLCHLSGVILLFLVVMMTWNPRLDVPGRQRELSLSGVSRGLTSIFVDDPRETRLDWVEFQNTKRWRFEWWRTIVEETVLGPLFWTGRGFGENLTIAHDLEDPGFAIRERPLRSPHNSHMTVLARAGVPGLFFWVLLNALLLKTFWSVRVRARKDHDPLFERIGVLLICYWVMFMMNTATDVFLEGPQGGIWYWSVMGIGLATRRIQLESSSRRPDASADVWPSRVPVPGKAAS